MEIYGNKRDNDIDREIERKIKGQRQKEDRQKLSD